MNSQSIAYFNEAIALNPDKPTLFTAYYNRGVAYFRQGDYDHAVEDYTKALELSPDEAEVYFDRGIAHSHNREFDHAIYDYTQALIRKPNYAEVHHNRGVAYRIIGKHDKALRTLTRPLN